MPSSTYREVPVTFEKGMAANYEDSLLPEGVSSLLENWVPEETGRLRVREGWRKSSMNGGPSPAKGLGLTTFSVTRKPTFRQRSMVTGVTSSNSSTTRTFTYNWPVSTTSGNMLLLKVSVAYESAASTYHYLQDAGGYQLFMAGNLGGSGNGHVDFWLIKENAASQSSATFKITAANTSSDMSYVIEGVELVNIQQGTPKNLLPGAAAFLGWFRSDGLTGFHFDGFGWFNDLNTVTANFQSDVPPWVVTGAGSPTGGTNPGLPQTAQYQIPVSTLCKVGTASGTSGVPVTPSTGYNASIWVQQNVQIDIRLNILWYDVSGTLITTVNEVAVTGNDTPQRHSLAATSPSNAAFAKMQLENTNTSGTSDTFLLSGAQF